MYSISLLLLLATAPLLGVQASHPSTPVAPDPPATMDLCYFMFAGLDDLGWTFSYNTGRLAAHKILQARYPNATVTSRYKENVFWHPDKRQNFLDHVYLGCRVFLTNSEDLIGGDDWAAATYPNISFILLSDTDSTNATAAYQFPNRVYLSLLMNAGFYAAGVAAALQTQTGKIGFVSAWEQFKHSSDAANGFVLGVASVNSSIEVDLVTMGSWFSPASETEIAHLLLDKGCDILGRITDAQFVDNVVKKRNYEEQRTKETGLLYSIGPHTKLQEYVGDSVLLSIHQQWENVLVPLLEQIFQFGNVEHAQLLAYGYENHTSFISALSPTAQTLQSTFDNTVIKNLSDSILCDRSLKLFDGSPAITPETLDPQTGCLSTAHPLRVYIDGGQRNHGIFQPSTMCPPGTRYSYSWDPLLTLSCDACPPDSISIQYGSADCSACPSGMTTHGRTNSTSCHSNPLPLPMGVIVLIVVAAIALGAAAGFVILKVCLAPKQRDVSAAPTDESMPFTLVFTDIQSSTNLWARIPQQMAEAVDTHHRIIRKLIKKHNGYEVKTIGDSFMVAFTESSNAVQFSVNLQDDFQQEDWGPCNEIDNVYRQLAEERQQQQQQHFASGSEYPLHLLPCDSGHENPLDIQTTNPTLLNIIDTTSQHSPSRNSSECPAPEGSSTLEGGTTATAGPSMTGSINEVAGGGVWNGLRVRVGIHHGMGEIKFDQVSLGYDYYGTVVNTAARVEGVGHGGQVLITGRALDSVAPLLDASIGTMGSTRPSIPGVTVKNLGAQPLRGLDKPVPLYQLLPDGLSTRKFPPLRLDNETTVMDEDDDTGVSDCSQHSGTGAGGAAQTPEALAWMYARKWKGVRGKSPLQHSQHQNQNQSTTSRFSCQSQRVAVFDGNEENCEQRVQSCYHDLLWSFLITKSLFSTSSDSLKKKVLEELARKWHVTLPKSRNKNVSAKMQWDRNLMKFIMRVTPAAEARLSDMQRQDRLSAGQHQSSPSSRHHQPSGFANGSNPSTHSHLPSVPSLTPSIFSNSRGSNHSKAASHGNAQVAVRAGVASSVMHPPSVGQLHLTNIVTETSVESFSHRQSPPATDTLPDDVLSPESDAFDASGSDVEAAATAPPRLRRLTVPLEM